MGLCAQPFVGSFRILLDKVKSEKVGRGLIDYLTKPQSWYPESFRSLYLFLVSYKGVQ